MSLLANKSMIGDGEVDFLRWGWCLVGRGVGVVLVAWNVRL